MKVKDFIKCVADSEKEEMKVLDPFGVLRPATFTLDTDGNIVIVPEGYGVGIIK